MASRGIQCRSVGQVYCSTSKGPWGLIPVSHKLSTGRMPLTLSRSGHPGKRCVAHKLPPELRCHTTTCCWTVRRKPPSRDAMQKDRDPASRRNHGTAFTCRRVLIAAVRGDILPARPLLTRILQKRACRSNGGLYRNSRAELYQSAGLSSPA